MSSKRQLILESTLRDLDRANTQLSRLSKSHGHFTDKENAIISLIQKRYRKGTQQAKELLEQPEATPLPPQDS